MIKSIHEDGVILGVIASAADGMNVDIGHLRLFITLVVLIVISWTMPKLMVAIFVVALVYVVIAMLIESDRIEAENRRKQTLSETDHSALGV